MKDKWDLLLFIATLIAGVAIIYLTPNGKDGYWIIPLIIYWTVRFFRNNSKKEK